MKTSAKSLVFSLPLAGAMLALGGVAYADTNNHVTRHHRSPRNVTWEKIWENAGAQSVAGGDERASSLPSALRDEDPVRETPRSAKSEEDALFPPEAKPGECWTRVLMPPPVETVQERVVVKEASFEMVEIPAQMETVQEQVMVRPERVREEVIPATYREVQEQVVRRPASTRKIPVPAQYETVTERVMVKPERSYWKKGHGPLEKIDNMTGEIMCYVTEPAVYEEVTRNVLKTPATVREEEVPAEFETVTRTVIDQPSRIERIVEPAEYQTVQVEKVREPARTERREIPAEYATVERQVTRGESRLEWRRILCETNASPEVIGELQNKLKERGFDAGEVDGIWGQRTARALSEFQGAQGLAQAGLTYETLQALQLPVE